MRSSWLWPLVLLCVPALALGQTDLASPWAWTCNASTAACSRDLADAIADQPLDLMQCKMTCSEHGLLWPLPTGALSLSKTLVAVAAADDFHIAIMDMDVAVAQHTTRFFEDVFKHYLNSMMPETRKKSSTPTKRAPARVELNLSVAQSLTRLNLSTDESYELSVSPASDSLLEVRITARSYYGLRHGLETLSQLVSWHAADAVFQMHDSVVIEDAPAYAYRGIMVDTSRNFMPLPVLKRVVDGMAHNKLNAFHWHVSDAVSFPLCLPSVPQLCRFGAYDSTLTYSVGDVADLVEYADLRGVQIVPEIDTPRHSANGWQFGELEGLGRLALCVNERKPECRGGVCGHLNPVNPNLYDVLEKVYGDVASAFPSDLVHMGGDEVEFDCWRQSEEVQDWLEQHGLSGSDDDMFALWVDFQRNASQRLHAAAEPFGPKTVVLWTSSLTDRENLTDSEIPTEGHIIQIWSNASDPSIARLVNKGYSVIMSNSDALYLDCGFGHYVRKDISWCDPYKQWRTIYDNDPRSIYAAQDPGHPERAAQVLGGEAAAWSESIGAASLETRVWPRGAALAERLWTRPMPAEDSWRAADTRLLVQRERMAQRGVAAEALMPRWCLHFDHRCVEE